MKCISFNCRGLASSSKKLAMKRLTESDPIDIIMLQETLCTADQITRAMQALTQARSTLPLMPLADLEVWPLVSTLVLLRWTRPGGVQGSLGWTFSLLNSA